jgi:hypothetical protein
MIVNKDLDNCFAYLIRKTIWLHWSMNQGKKYFTNKLTSAKNLGIV